MKPCPYCKGVNPDEARFCGHCGGSLTIDVPSPDSVSGQRQSLSRKQLDVAGWLSVISAVVAIPLIGISVALEEGGVVSRTINNLLTILDVGLFVYIFSIFKQLLSTLFNFHAIDSLILLLIWANIIASALSVSPLPVLEEGVMAFALTALMVLAVIALGVVYIVFAMKLLTLPHNLFGLLKPFCYTSICEGFCLAMIILIPIGLVASLVSSLMLAIIFFRAGDHPLVVE